MSSLICANNLCTFTRIDTDTYAATPMPSYVEHLSDYYGGSLSRPEFLAKTTTDGDLETLAPWTDPLNQDLLSDTVALTRDFQGNLFNALVQDDIYDYSSPSGTEWALLPEGQSFEEARCSLQFCDWNDCFSGYDPSAVIGKEGVVHLIEEDVYYYIKFLSWTDNEYDTYNSVGGGFSYVRDEKPFSMATDLPECPKCSEAVATQPILKGAIDESMIEVGITGVTAADADAKITIKAVAQDVKPRLNGPPNAQGLGNDTVKLRRTRVQGELTPIRYTVYFDAATEAGTCSGEVSVCVPIEGFDDCETYYLGYDATATGPTE